MKISRILFATFLFSLAASPNAYSADILVSNVAASGGRVTITTTDSPGPNVLFDPSTNVVISGGSSATAFVVAGYHTAVLDRTSGQQYAMASDTNTMFWRDISNSSSAQDPQTLTAATTNSTDLDANWNTM